VNVIVEPLLVAPETSPSALPAVSYSTRPPVPPEIVVEPMVKLIVPLLPMQFNHAPFFITAEFIQRCIVIGVSVDIWPSRFRTDLSQFRLASVADGENAWRTPEANVIAPALSTLHFVEPPYCALIRLKIVPVTAVFVESMESRLTVVEVFDRRS